MFICKQNINLIPHFIIRYYTKNQKNFHFVFSKGKKRILGAFLPKLG